MVKFLYDIRLTIYYFCLCIHSIIGWPCVLGCRYRGEGGQNEAHSHWHTRLWRSDQQRELVPSNSVTVWTLWAATFQWCVTRCLFLSLFISCSCHFLCLSSCLLIWLWGPSYSYHQLPFFTYDVFPPFMSDSSVCLPLPPFLPSPICHWHGVAGSPSWSSLMTSTRPTCRRRSTSTGRKVFLIPECTAAYISSPQPDTGKDPHNTNKH